MQREERDLHGRPVSAQVGASTGYAQNVSTTYHPHIIVIVHRPWKESVRCAIVRSMALLFLFTTGAAAGGRLRGLPGWLAHSPRGWDGPVHRHGTLHNTAQYTRTLHTDTAPPAFLAWSRCGANMPTGQPESESTDTDCSLHPLGLA